MGDTTQVCLANAAAAIRSQADQAAERCVALGGVAMNMKKQPVGDAGELLKEFLINSPCGALRGWGQGRIQVAMEEVSEYDGSGCAVWHTMSALQNLHTQQSAMDPGFDEGLPLLGLLVAGQGSRLWGISASTGFVKALVCLFRTTLFELSVAEARMLMSQAPEGGRGMVFVAGTDNVLVPSTFPLRTVKGELFSDLETIPSLTLFSKAVAVLDESFEPLPNAPLDMLEQLGILVVNEEGRPVEFLEKVPKERIVAVLQHHRRRDAFFNAFVFGFRKEAMNLMVEMYSRPTNANPYVSFGVTKDFDFSGHVLEALICADQEAWMRRHDRKGPFPHVEDWKELFRLAQQFKERMGPIAVVNMGYKTVWYDTGMTSDLLDLYRSTVASEDLVLRDTLRSVLGVTEEDFKDGAIVINSSLPEGSTVGAGAVVVNSSFEVATQVPAGCLVVNSSLHSLDCARLPSLPTNSVHDCIVYNYCQPQTSIALESGLAFFTAQLTQGTGVEVAAGAFPIHVNAKKIEHEPQHGHYNTGCNSGKRYLDQSIKDFPGGLSFKQLFSSQQVSFPASLSNFKEARAYK